MWPFTKSRKAESELLKAFIEADVTRRKLQSELDTGRLSLEIRKQELEFEHLDAMAENRRKDREDAAKLKEQRRQWAADARAKKAQKEIATTAVPGARGIAPSTCRVCATPSEATLTTAEIMWHHNGHRATG